jgi:hypothetical protein
VRSNDEGVAYRIETNLTPIGEWTTYAIEARVWKDYRQVFMHRYWGNTEDKGGDGTYKNFLQHWRLVRV